MSGRSLPVLVKETVAAANRLVRLELQLAAERAKAGLKKKVMAAGIGAGGALFLLFGLLFLLGAGAAGLAVVFPWWLALLIVGGGCVLIGLLLALMAMLGLRSSGSVVPKDEKGRIKEDLRWVREKSA